MFTNAIDALKAAASAYAADLDAAEADFAEVDSIFRAWDMAACVEAIRLDSPLPLRLDATRRARLEAGWDRTMARLGAAEHGRTFDVLAARCEWFDARLSTEKLAETLVRLDV